MDAQYAKHLEKILKGQQGRRPVPKGFSGAGVKNLGLYALRGANKGGNILKLGASPQIGLRGGLQANPNFFKVKRGRLF